MTDILVFLVFIFATYGLSNMVVYSNGPFGVFRKWREFSIKINEGFGELFSCMICFPTWAAAFLSSVNLYLTNWFSFTPMNKLFEGSIYDLTPLMFWATTFVVIGLDALIGSGATWVIHNIEEWFEERG